jgi:hypothetical protein
MAILWFNSYKKIFLDFKFSNALFFIMKYA